MLIAAAFLTWPAAANAQAQPTSASPSERRLTPEQIEAILNEAAAKRETAPMPRHEEVDEPEAPRAPQVHGEVGFAIGTGGYREAYGTAIYPLGGGSVAAISFDFVDDGRHRFRR
jgi:hypothetical protein